MHRNENQLVFSTANGRPESVGFIGFPKGDFGRVFPYDLVYTLTGNFRRDSELGHARRGKAGRGSAGLGTAWRGPARQGKARQGKARQGKARQGKARQGKARQGKARQGKARQGISRRHPDENLRHRQATALPRQRSLWHRSQSARPLPFVVQARQVPHPSYLTNVLLLHPRRDADREIALGGHSRGLKAPSRRRSASKSAWLSRVSSTRVSTAKPENLRASTTRLPTVRRSAPSGSSVLGANPAGFFGRPEGFPLRPFTNQPLPVLLAISLACGHLSNLIRIRCNLSVPDQTT